ncbi:MAG TPA: peptidoglycan-binding domain-containing protein, partial [Pyrinomonadaceae bacterium]
MTIEGHNLSLGMQGREVAELHKQLVELGFEISAEEIDGQTYGETTYRAVRSFQRSQGLHSEGIVDEETAHLLSRALERQSTKKPVSPADHVPEDSSVRTPPSISDASNVLSETVGSFITSSLLSRLSHASIQSLQDVQKAGGLGHLQNLDPEDAKAAQLIESLADLDRISSDLATNASLIRKGYGSVQSIAEAPVTEFVRTSSETLGDFAAAKLHVSANAHVNALNTVLAGLMVDSALDRIAREVVRTVDTPSAFMGVAGNRCE